MRRPILCLGSGGEPRVSSELISFRTGPSPSLLAAGRSFTSFARTVRRFCVKLRDLGVVFFGIREKGSARDELF